MVLEPGFEIICTSALCSIVLLFACAVDYFTNSRFPHFTFHTSHVQTERKGLLFFLLHFVVTMVVWSHFFLKKYEVQESKVPIGANRYWEKRLIPPLEFGAMHAILLQMALLPITMCRGSISYFQSVGLLRKLIPFNRTMDFHIHLGYTMVFMVFLATVVFFAFFGTMCREQLNGIEPRGPLNNNTWCEKFTSEIMLTGYGILLSLLLVAGTSYLRNVIRYEIFYVAHHLVFAMFAIAVAHTLDKAHMQGVKNRSQTFKWFVFSIWAYGLDRAFSYFSRTYEVYVNLAQSTASGTVYHNNMDKESSTTATASTTAGGGRCVLLTVRRPIEFIFESGQWAFVQIPSIDHYWHPFSIASEPMSHKLEFMVEVKGPDSWSEKLWDLVHAQSSASMKKGEFEEEEGEELESELESSLRGTVVQIQGPFGQSIMPSNSKSHVIAIGGGSGIVPMVSLLRRNTAALSQFDQGGYHKVLQQKQSAACELAQAFDRSIFNILMGITLGSLSRVAKSGTMKRLHLFLLKVLDYRETKASIIDTNRRRTSMLSSFASSSAGGRQSVAADKPKAASLISTWYRYLKLTKKSTGNNTTEPPNATIRYFNRRTAFSNHHTLVSLAYALFPTIGAFTLAFAWSTSTHLEDGTPLQAWAPDTVELTTYFSILGFGMHSLGQSSTSILTYVDFTIFSASIVACVLWTRAQAWGYFSELEFLAYIGGSVYMLIRFWGAVVLEEGVKFSEKCDLLMGNQHLPEKFELIWSTRSAPQVIAMLPLLNSIMRDFHEQWHKFKTCETEIIKMKLTQSMQSVSVYVTDRDEAACKALQILAIECPFVKLYFERPNFYGIFADHVTQLAFSDKKFGARITSPTIAFCGSTGLGCFLDNLRRRINWGLQLCNAAHHSVFFEQENFGHSGTPPPSAAKRVVPVESSTSSDGSIPKEVAMTKVELRQPSLSDEMPRGTMSKKE